MRLLRPILGFVSQNQHCCRPERARGEPRFLPSARPRGRGQLEPGMGCRACPWARLAGRDEPACEAPEWIAWCIQGMSDRFARERHRELLSALGF